MKAIRYTTLRRTKYRWLSVSDEYLNLTSCFLLPQTYYKDVRVGEGDRGGHVLRETTSRGLCGLVCPSRTSEHGGEGDCVKEGGGYARLCDVTRFTFAGCCGGVHATNMS